MAALDELHAEAIFTVFRVLIDITVELERFEQRVERAFAQTHLFTDVSDLQLRRLFVKQIEDMQGTFNRLNNRHN
ncbi:hypothetical protein D3C71_933160 [compost metagenome]